MNMSTFSMRPDRSRAMYGRLPKGPAAPAAAEVEAISHKQTTSLRFPALRTAHLVVVLGLLCVGFGIDSATAAALNIVALGASNTSGWGVGSQMAYPARLETMLKAKGYDAHVTNAGVSFDTTGGMLRRVDSAVPAGTSIVVFNPGGNDLRFFGSKEQRDANIAAIVGRLGARHIKVVAFENTVVPPNLYQWDGIHFNAEGHNFLAAYLLPRVIAAAKPVDGTSHRPPTVTRAPD
jgi:acyl-CoA thioesterase-1